MYLQVKTNSAVNGKFQAVLKLIISLLDPFKNELENKKDDLAKANDYLPVITYIAGYCVYSVTKKLKCDKCREVLISPGGNVGSVVEWLKRQPRDQHGLGSKPNRAILLCPWKRHFTALFPAWWSWQAVLNYSHISIKLLADSNILASPEAGRGNCLPYVLAPPSLSCESGG